MSLLIVNYTKSGRAIADHEVESELLMEAWYCDKGQSHRFNVSTENVISAVRYLILSEKITCDVQISFEGTTISMNEFCVLEKWPYGFCDYVDRWTSAILSLQAEKRTKNQTEEEKKLEINYNRHKWTCSVCKNNIMDCKC